MSLTMALEDKLKKKSKYRDETLQEMKCGLTICGERVRRMYASTAAANPIVIVEMSFLSCT